MNRLLCLVAMLTLLIACSDSDVPVWQWSRDRSDGQPVEAGRFQMAVADEGLPLILDTQEGFVWQAVLDKDGRIQSFRLVLFDGEHTSALGALHNAGEMVAPEAAGKEKKEEASLQLEEPPNNGG